MWVCSELLDQFPAETQRWLRHRTQGSLVTTLISPSAYGHLPVSLLKVYYRMLLKNKPYLQVFEVNLSQFILFLQKKSTCMCLMPLLLLDGGLSSSEFTMPQGCGYNSTVDCLPGMHGTGGSILSRKIKSYRHEQSYICEATKSLRSWLKINSQAQTGFERLGP